MIVLYLKSHVHLIGKLYTNTTQAITSIFNRHRLLLSIVLSQFCCRCWVCEWWNRY